MNVNESDSTNQEIRLTPVGVVRNQSRELNWGKRLGLMNWQGRAAEMDKQSNSVSELVIDASLDGVLDGIEDFSHLTVLYWAHRAPPERRSVTRVHPMGNKDFPLVGVFATHSPVRPNSILTTVVRLLKREGNILTVTGLDALDGSPILDIKPCMTTHSELKDFRIPDWMRRMHEVFRGRQSS
jgi:tRNA-Thr(GGU) m(6)t(6)A37 methyltransferase TsaA